jgi:hypothetical protein
MLSRRIRPADVGGRLATLADHIWFTHIRTINSVVELAHVAQIASSTGWGSSGRVVACHAHCCACGVCSECVFVGDAAFFVRDTSGRDCASAGPVTMSPASTPQVNLEVSRIALSLAQGLDSMSPARIYPLLVMVPPRTPSFLCYATMDVDSCRYRPEVIAFSYCV